MVRRAHRFLPTFPLGRGETGTMISIPALRAVSFFLLFCPHTNTHVRTHTHAYHHHHHHHRHHRPTFPLLSPSRMNALNETQTSLNTWIAYIESLLQGGTLRNGGAGSLSFGTKHTSMSLAATHFCHAGTARARHRLRQPCRHRH